METYERALTQYDSKKPLTCGLECEVAAFHSDGRRDCVDIHRELEGMTGWHPEKGVVMPGTHIDRDAARNLVELVSAPFKIELSSSETVTEAPFRSLLDLQNSRRTAIDAMIEHLEPRGIILLGLGANPLHTLEDGAKIWRDKHRYKVLQNALGYGRHHPTLMAGAQQNVSVRDEVEAMQRFNDLLALTPLFTAMSANSSIMGGEVQEAHSWRQLAWDSIGPGRVGMPVRPYFSLEEYVDWMLGTKVFITFYGTEGNSGYGQTLKEEMLSVAKAGFSEDEVLKKWHDVLGSQIGTLWGDVRLRLTGVTEVRPICQQVTPELGMSFAALVLGLCQNVDGRQEIIERMTWDGWRCLRESTARFGYKAFPDYEAVVMTAIAAAQSGLRDRDLGEEVLLDPLLDRPHLQPGSVESARSIFRADGVTGLFNAYRWRHSSEATT